MRFFAQVIANALAIFLATYLMPQSFIFEGDILTLIIAGLILGLINFFIRPVLMILASPLIALSLGLFIFIINIGLLWLLQYLVPELTINGFWAYFWGALIIGAINIILGTKRKRKN